MSFSYQLNDSSRNALAIKARGLSKTYRAKVKAEGLAASFRALVKPEWRTVEAVRGIDLDIERGEIVAFIGPNGAGKSTFIKMLCGILYPSGGDVSVLGISPQRERRRLAMKIGAVFGQKSQLWLHLPATDSFTLLSAIYEIDDRESKRRVGELTELFGLSEFIDTPVRKLSLGQRVRCEVAASLLHDPEILFLDEPTIGLDVVVKQTIRELILKRNREKGTTVFLTSHDPADIEHLCRRAIVIDRGAIVLDQPVNQMRSEYLGNKTIDVTFGIPQTLPSLSGVTALYADSGAVVPAPASVIPVLAAPAPAAPITDLPAAPAPESTASTTVAPVSAAPALVAAAPAPAAPVTDLPAAPAPVAPAGYSLRWTLNVDTSIRPIGDVMNRLSELGSVLDITINNPPMEDIIAAIFEKEGAI